MVAAQRAYSIVAIPGDSHAGKAICSAQAVVGSSDGQAIRFDASGLTDLGTPGVVSKAAAGNDAGTIVGSSYVHAVIFRDGTTTELPTLNGGVEAQAYGINNRDQIVGESQILPGGGDVPNHAVLWDSSCTVIDLGSLGSDSFARDINDAGTIVGTAVDASNQPHAVSWDLNATLTDLGLGQAMAINSSGAIAGFSGNRAIVWQSGTMVDIGTLGGPGAFALGIDDRGDVVGASSIASGPGAHAFFYSNGEMIALEQFVDTSHWQLIEATDVCDDGMIVGNGLLDGQSRGYVLTPVDE